MNHRQDDRLLLTDSMLVRMIEEDGWKLNYVARKGDRIMTNASLDELARQILGPRRKANDAAQQQGSLVHVRPGR
jgi:hypothetical protein